MFVILAGAMPKPFTIEQAVARFFPLSTSYDTESARRLISWLESCGYAIAEKAPAAPEPARQPKRVRTLEGV